MKSTVAILGAMAAVASAYSPAQHLHFPRANSTTTAAPAPASASDMTSLTVKTTVTRTIISCAPTVTNCPADEKGMSAIPESDRATKVVTDTVVLTETVCPVTEAERIASQVQSQHATPTQTAGPSASQSMTTKVVDVVNEKTVTITLGVGASQSVVPTVIKSTIQQTVTVTCDTEEETTTTTTATSTSTRTVTVALAKPTETGGSSSGGDSSAEGCDSAPAETVTVTVAQTTVTAPASTVYVTVPCDASQTDSGSSPAVTGQSGDDTNSKYTDNSGSNGNNGGDSGNNGQDNKPVQSEDCPPDETTTLQATVTVVPYPTGQNNGTTTTGAAGPSGFARLRR